MSVKFKKAGHGRRGRFEVTTEADFLTAEDYVERVCSLIRILQAQEEDRHSIEDTYVVLEILNDMMPTPEQAEKMFNCPH